MKGNKNYYQNKVIYDKGLLTDHDIYLVKQGNHSRMYEKMGAILDRKQGGTHFAVWAPNADKVSVIGDFNTWDPTSHLLELREDGSGIWEGFIPGVSKGEIYKFHIESENEDHKVDKADPYAKYAEKPPKTASKVWDFDFAWSDQEWMESRSSHNSIDSPISVYEFHLGSWRRVPEEDNRFLTYKEIAPKLTDYVKENGFTHVELLPVMEHPFYGSWGYQVTGYFAPTSRYGTPEDFMYLVDYLHRNGVGVILDWVPSHFPNDEHGLVYFDGTHLYEHADPRKGFHPDWKSCIFNYGRDEVRNFLISSALFWLDKYHVDGLRLDGVASMLYLDYSREEGEWIPNQYGGRENIEAIEFLRQLNDQIKLEYPQVLTIAEESTSWPMVTRSTQVGGLGFDMKWNMGWMHDSLEYFSKDPVYRKHHKGQLTFSIWYAFSENFILSLSHDEVVHGKGSLLGKMPGDDWQKFANLRLLLGYMYSHPGKKLLFMGGEFGQWDEWEHDGSLDWDLLDYENHRGILHWISDLNSLYKNYKAMHEMDCHPDGFEWLDYSDWKQCIISYLRKGESNKDPVLVICNFTPVPRHNYRVGVPQSGKWEEILNSDAQVYGGSGQGNFGRVKTSPIKFHGREHSLSLTLPPLGILFLRPNDE